MIVEVSSRKFGVPFECPCCGAPPETDIKLRAPGQAPPLAFPYCRRCLAHSTTWESAGIAGAGVMVGGIIIAIVLAIAIDLVAAPIAFVVAAVVAWWLRQSRRAAAKAGCGASCATPGLALAYLGGAGEARSFSFESPTFAARFAEQNSAILANVGPQLRKLLDGYRKARLAVPTPAVAAGVAPPPLTTRDWLARIEATEGVVARRVALGRALDMIEAPSQRRELVQTVARLELEPLVTKVARLGSAAARREQLEQALATVRADNILDELEAVLVEQLQARLQELR